MCIFGYLFSGNISQMTIHSLLRNSEAISKCLACPTSHSKATLLLQLNKGRLLVDINHFVQKK